MRKKIAENIEQNISEKIVNLRKNSAQNCAKIYVKNCIYKKCAKLYKIYGKIAEKIVKKFAKVGKIV